MSYCTHPENEFYDYVPDPLLNSGDIIEFDPSDHLPINSHKYLVISPSCDLAQKKTESVSILPLITINEYFSRPQMLDTEIYKRIEKITPDTYKDALKQRLWGLSDYVGTYIDHLQPQDIARMKALLKWLSELSYTHLKHIDNDIIQSCLGTKDYCEVLKKIMVDNYKPDTYYLPQTKLDKKDRIHLQNGSIALLRTPIMVPYELIEIAYSSDTNWDDVYAANHLNAKKFFKDCPVKIGQLKQRFYNDLYAKYLAYQIRVGSPDFTESFITLSAKRIYPEGEI